jgi:hypothetical protein
MWCAMAESYEKLSRTEDAVKCYLRAEGNEDREGIALNKLAKLYNKLGDTQMVCCLLSAVCCLLSAVCCLLSAVCCLLSAVCCLLSAVCRLPCDVCRLMSDV